MSAGVVDTGRPYRATLMTGIFRAGRRMAAPVAVLMAVTLAGVAPAAAAPPAHGWKPPPAPKDVTGVRVTPVNVKPRPTWTAAAREVRGGGTVTWPAADVATVDLSITNRASVGVKAGALPVHVAPAAPDDDADRRRGATASVRQVRVQILDRTAAEAAGVRGVVLKVSRADTVRSAGAVRITVDYRGFANAFGGTWASRLRLVRLPDGKPLVTDNNMTASTLTARVPLAADGTATTVAATAGASGSDGDYTATSLSPAGTWQVSQQTGDFSWSYPLRMPPAVGGPTATLTLAYSSGSIDGRTGGTNTQGSWIGDGWDLWPGYVERKYRSCADDKDAVEGTQPNNKNLNTWDQCWFNANATMSFNGRATELVRVNDSLYRSASDDGSKIELLKNAALGNGDGDGEYWKVTTVDGTQYFFGRNTGPGGASGTTATKSTWTAPVYGNHPGEPGYTAGNYAVSNETQAWRWNLDYVVDPHGNTLTYFYERETGAYGREGDPAKRTTYIRGGWLSRIEYGNRADAPASTRAAARVLFEVADRCSANCYEADGDPAPANWVDTPWDQYCKAAPCTDQLAPTFWTGKRLAKMTTQVYAGAGDSYQNVESWTLRHTYLHAGGNEGKPMWLRGITRTGKVTGTDVPEVSDPEVVFDPGADALANRVDGPADGRSNLFRYRVNTITTEAGAQIAVTYSSPECTRGALPAVHSNTKRCYPQFYAPAGEEPTRDWFHKYVVTRVDVYDNTGGFIHQQTNYDYLDTPAWHYDDSELVQEKKRTWGQYRGYSKVRMRSGLTSGVQSATEYLYFRGMHGDKQPTGTRTVSIVDSQGTAVQDHDAYSGMLREETVLNGVGGQWVSGSINTPFLRGPTATFGPLKAWMTNTGTARARTRLSAGTTRWTKTLTEFNNDNLPTQVEDLGDEATAADDRCTRTDYARNDTKWMLDKVKRVETVGVNCAATPTRPADVISDVRTYYDNESAPHGTPPTRGLVVKVDEVGSWAGSTPQYVVIGRTTYDANGRPIDAYDALGRKTTSAYTPATAGPLTQTVTTNPLGHQVTTTTAPAWGLPVKMVDSNNAMTEMSYDASGRLTKVWLPGRLKATFPKAPNLEFAYLLRNNASTAVTTKTLVPISSSTYKTTVKLFDGLLRERQVQTQAPGGGRVIADTVHDSRGLVDWTNTGYYDISNAGPSTTLVTSVGQPEIPALTENVYDGAGRVTAAIFKVNGVEKWRTTTAYDGERTNVAPPSGGTATTSIVDARDRPVELRQYKNPGSLGGNDPTTYDRTTYAYTDRDLLSVATDPAGNTWRYGYDQRGRKIREEDPDRGVTTMTYDTAGQMVTSTDARGITLATTYDALGRRTSLRDGSVAGNKRSEWVYDSLPRGFGKPTKSIRYEPAGSTNQYVNEVTGYDAAGRPTGTRVTIPASEGGLCAAVGSAPCTYTYAMTYRADGQIGNLVLPVTGGLPAETLIHTYNDVSAPSGLIGSGTTEIYAGEVSYNKLGQLTRRVLGQDGHHTWLTYVVDEPTGRLLRAGAVPELKPEISYYQYSYDDAGNLTKISDTPAGGTAESQCYRHDYLRRLTEAWTPSSGDCGPAPTLAGLGGPAKYWHSYTYDKIGNRLTEVQHAANNTTRTYAYPAPGGAAGSKPHAVTGISTTGAVNNTQAFTYDEAGFTTCRPAGAAGNICPSGAGTQTLTWDPEGHLARNTDATGATSNIYDAEGSRLIRKDPTGATLYLPGGMEIRKPTTGNAVATRYYSHAGTTVATRTPAGLTWLVGDHHNTGEAAITNTDLTVIRRRSLPFGEVRGVPPTAWAGDKGFVGGTNDNTGLTHLGAREYDPAAGRFLSVDPIMDLTDPQQWNAYAYANNNPAIFADPSGLWYARDDGSSRGDGPSPATPKPPHRKKSTWQKLGEFASGFRDGWNDWGNNTVNGVKDFVEDPVGTLRATANEAARWNKKIGADPSFAYGYYCVFTGVCQIVEDWQNGNYYESGYGTGGLAVDAVLVAASAATGGAGAGAGAGTRTTSAVARLSRTPTRLGPRGSRVPWRARCNSFVPGTAVLLANGDTKPIEDLRVGNAVLATDPKSNRTEAKLVVATIEGQGRKQLVKITIDVDGGRGSATASVTATAGHPFWVPQLDQWVNAGDLRSGQWLRTAAGARVQVTAVQHWTKTTRAHNLTVADVHTYYVVVGATPVLVHNCPDDTPGGGTPKIGPTKGKPNWQDGSISPGEGWEWRGPGAPGTPNRGGWYNPTTKETLHPDLNHAEPIGPHYDYRAPDGTFYRMFPDGRIELR